ncbi:F0F1 ATP synthase subunit delta [Pseudovibrio exalbescens]|uniref:ATP synthase subunit delta n=1 Tax=Pseudovibrio exalbescens TaxID=197461 RepID=A0A1U7JJ69_9HYPH|nr:F0F1 ATP synthase subunit delta [Pseudovibrio exalbescens]
MNAPESTDPVTDNVSLISGVALRYASALLELAEEQNAVAEVEAALDRFDALIKESSDLDRLIKSPVFSADAQTKALTPILEKAGISGLTANFVKLVAKNRRLFAIPGMISAFRSLLAAKRGEVTAEVTSATELSADHTSALREALNASTGKDVNVVVKVDPSIIGGLIVKVGSRMIDTSLRTKLNSLKFAMKEVG